MDKGMTNLDDIQNSIDVDLISNVPEDIRIKILLSLPLEEAVRTCILSTKWRSTWTHLPSLTFDDTSYISKYGEIEGRNRFRKMVDGVLYRHKGSIIRFILSCERFESNTIGRWIEDLQRQHMEYLQIQSTAGAQLRLPLHFFSDCRFKWVQLTSCIVRLPRTCSFQFLQKLSLASCSIVTSELQYLISSSVFLTKLQLILCKGGMDSCLYVESARLQWLHVHGSFFHIHLLTPHLTEARLLLLDHRLNVIHFKKSKCTVSLAKALGSLPNIECLWLSQAFLLTSISTQFHQTLVHLKELCLFADFHDTWETRVVYSLMKHCPFLDRLFITNCNKLERMGEDSISWTWEEEAKHFSLHSLTILQIEYFRRGSLSIFVMMALRTAPNLRELIFKNPVDILTQEELHGYPWASRNCRIIFNHHFLIQAPPNQF